MTSMNQPENVSDITSHLSEAGVPLESITSDYVYSSGDDEKGSVQSSHKPMSTAVDIENMEEVDNMISITSEISGEVDREYNGQFEGPEKNIGMHVSTKGWPTIRSYCSWNTCRASHPTPHRPGSYL